MSTEMFEDPRDPEFRDQPAAATKALPEKKQDLQPIDKARAALTKLETEFAKVLPQHIPPEKFTRMVVTSLQNNPYLLTLNQNSLFGACMAAAHDGLLPDGREAALVPYKGQIKYSPMVWGIVKKIRQAGGLSMLVSEVVYEKDKFRKWTDDSGEHIEHEPEPFADRGQKVGCFAMLIFEDGSRQIEVMNMKQIRDAQNCSQADKGPWNGPFADEMVRKTVVKRLSKRCPMSPEVQQVIARDDEFYQQDPPSKRGLAGELNGEGKEPENSTGDKIESLSDLRKPGNGSMPHQNLGGNSDRCGMEHSADVQEAPHGAARGAGQIPGEIPSLSVEDRGEGLGDPEVLRQTSPAPSALEGSSRKGAKPGPKPKGEKRW